MIRRIGLLVVVVLLGLSVGTRAARAQGGEATPGPGAAPAAPNLPPFSLPSGVAPELFAWYNPSQPDFGLAALYFVLGAAGALVTVYLFLGEFLPSMGGKGEYVKLQAQLEYFQDWRRRLLDAHWEGVKGKPGLSQEEVQLLMAIDRLSDDLDGICKDLERQMSSERWRLFLLGFPLYVILGGLFAVAFARDVLQAVLIGFGWTAVAERFGMAREQAVRKEFRDQQIEELRQRAIRAEEMEPVMQEVDKLRSVARTASEFSREVEAAAGLILARLDGTRDLLNLLEALPGTPERTAAMTQAASSLENVKEVVRTLERSNGRR